MDRSVADIAPLACLVSLLALGVGLPRAAAQTPGGVSTSNSPSTDAHPSSTDGSPSPVETHSLDVVTYNLRMIWCFPEFNAECSPEKTRAHTFRGFEDVPFTKLALGSFIDDPTVFRARRIAGRLVDADADVVVLTEAAQDGPVNETMAPILREAYPHHTGLDRPFSPFYYYEGGIVIFSRHSISSADTEVLNHRKPDAARGAVHAEISNRGKSYDIFGVHLWPDNCPGSSHDCTCEDKKEAHWEPHQRPRLRALDSYVTDREDGDTPSIVAGDFNVGTGLHKCGRFDRSRFQPTLRILDAVEPAHPKATIGRPNGRILDHILLRNVDLSSTSTAKTLTYRSKYRKTGIGESRRKLSDHHPVRADIHVCEVPTIVSATTNSPSNAERPPQLEVELADSVRCPGLTVEWQAAPTADFEKLVYEETESYRRRQPSTFRHELSADAVDPPSPRYWRLKVGTGLEVDSEFRGRHQSVLWAPPSYEKTVRTSPPRRVDLP